MPNLGIVKEAQAEGITLAHVAEVDVELRSCGQLACDFDRPFALFPFGTDRDIAAVTLERCDQNGGDFIAGLEFRIIKGGLILSLEPVGSTLVGRFAVLVHEFRLAIDELDILGPPTALWIRLLTSARRFGGVKPRVIEISVIHLADHATLHVLHFPYIGQLSCFLAIFIAIGLAWFATVTDGRAGEFIAETEDTVIDIPHDRHFVFMELVVIVPLVCWILHFFPFAISLLDVRAEFYRVGRVFIDNKHIEHVCRIDDLQGAGGVAHIAIIALEEIYPFDRLEIQNWGALPGGVIRNAIQFWRCRDLYRGDRNRLLGFGLFLFFLRKHA